MITVPQIQTTDANHLVPIPSTHIFQQIEPIASIIAQSSNRAWKDLNDGLQKVKIETSKSDTQTKTGLKSGDAVSSSKRVKSRQNSGIKLSQDQSDTTIKNKLSKIRTVSQNHNFRSHKKVQETGLQKQQQQKKAERLQLITKRKMELMEKLKRIDAQLVDARRHPSPIVDKSFENRSLVSKNQSFLSNSRNKFVGDNMQNHSKAVQMIQKLNMQKMKRQQKMAQEMHKKQQIELMKIQELEKKRKQQLQQRRKRTQMPTLKPNRNHRLQSIKTKMNEFSEQSQSSVMPSTIVPRLNGQKIDIDSNQFLENLDKKRPSYVLTENNFDNEQQVQSHEIIKDKQDHKEEQKEKEDGVNQKQQEQRQMYDKLNKSFVQQQQNQSGSNRQELNAHQNIESHRSSENEQNKRTNNSVHQNELNSVGQIEKNDGHQNQQSLGQSNQRIQETGFRIQGQKGQQNIGVQIKY